VRELFPPPPCVFSLPLALVERNRAFFLSLLPVKDGLVVPPFHGALPRGAVVSPLVGGARPRTCLLLFGDKAFFPPTAGMHISVFFRFAFVQGWCPFFFFSGERKSLEGNKRHPFRIRRCFFVRWELGRGSRILFKCCLVFGVRKRSASDSCPPIFRCMYGEG